MNSSIEETNEVVEEILKEQKVKVKQLLKDNIQYYCGILKELLKHKVLMPKQLVENSHQVVVNYKDITECFLDKNK